MYLKKNSTIAIVDSGIGGVSILKSLIKKFGFGNYIYYADNYNMPYGYKSKDFIKNRVISILDMLTNEYKVDLIIVACNTASSCVDVECYKNVMVLTFEKNYTYLTTPLTKLNLTNKRAVACDHLATTIENLLPNVRNKLTDELKNIIKEHELNKMKDLCLACTHYELIKELFEELLPKTNIINNSDSIISEITMERSEELNVVYLSSKNSLAYINKLMNLTNS